MISGFSIISIADRQRIKLNVFVMLNENVLNLLKAGMWDLATCANGEPNVVPVAFKDVTEDGKLLVGDVFLETTLNNIKADGGRIAVSVYDAQNLEGYQIKGVAEYVTEGAVVDTFKAMVEKMALLQQREH